MPNENNLPESDGDVEGTGNEARLALLEKLADNSESERAEDLAHVNDNNTTEPFQVKKEDEEPPAEEPKVEEEPPKKYKLKIDGEEVEVTEEELIARAQKVSAADKYLADAAAARRAAVAAPEPEIPKGPSPEEIQRRQDDEDKALVRAIQMGTEEEAAAALRKLREQTASRVASISPDDVARTIDQRLAFNEAINKFRTDFSDVVEDPYLNKMALDMDAQMLEAGDRRAYSERYDEIGKKIRAWKEALVSKSSNPAEQLQAKEDRKAAAPKVPVAASAKTKAPAAEDEGEEDPREVIRAMQERRGGPQWMR